MKMSYLKIKRSKICRYCCAYLAACCCVFTPYISRNYLSTSLLRCV